ncbi:MAG: hypothetical protein II630_09410, partial [Bacteroidales bacterium]|nr:hypothetical protein [Bacteroidales bacterium]
QHSAAQGILPREPRRDGEQGCSRSKQQQRPGMEQIMREKDRAAEAAAGPCELPQADSLLLLICPIILKNNGKHKLFKGSRVQRSNNFKQFQTISNHLKPSQTTSNHLKQFQTI